MITIDVVRREEQKTSKWGGGVTTELAIWPRGADYASRGFEWRISTARVELEESVFTALPGVSRWLMMLDGEIHLTHEGIRELDMKPFAPTAQFDGAWKTKSKGRCVDFNLMTKEGYTGGLGYVPAGAASVKVFENCKSQSWEAFYCLVPSLELSVEDERRLLHRGDFMLLGVTGVHNPIDITITCADNIITAARATVKRTD